MVPWGILGRLRHFCQLSMERTRILLLADTHLGYDSPTRPRIERRRRGEEFLRNYLLALQVARDRRVDLLVHGGDLFFRSRIPDSLVSRAFTPLIEVAERGIPIYMVPGNHERSSLRQGLFELHPGIRVFARPRTFRLQIRGTRIALSGFPFLRGDARAEFATLARETGWNEQPADVSLLCLHQAVDGARVGVQNHTFRDTPDVIRHRDVPEGFDAVLVGHIHRYQVLNTDVPVYYPGATCRTSFAERLEPKGCLVLDATCDRGRVTIRHEFIGLPVRPMVDFHVSSRDTRDGLVARFAALDPESIVRVGADEPVEWLRMEGLRSLAPPTMNIEIKLRWQTR